MQMFDNFIYLNILSIQIHNQSDQEYEPIAALQIDRQCEDLL
jgi:hypothetical protein